ncbi:MAG: 16S rRNA (guanine(966)-N(2))-methyltransferase RsmD [Clostridia bacterium]|nr:16S rRNA (guanine(966)-N(2))-methyltransferase RsmD [Clostridia bacterium]
MLRIITGTAKGKKLKTLEGVATRPTSERIKEAIFSSLQFDVEGRRVLDLFAGCGQMGLEAISRGAVSCTFIDSEREAMDIVKENARACGFFDRSKFLVSDYRNYIRKAASRDRFDLVFIDPPYAMACAEEAAKRLAAAGMLALGALVVLEVGEESVSADGLSDFTVVKSTAYGKKTAVTILLYNPSSSEV